MNLSLDKKAAKIVLPLVIVICTFGVVIMVANQRNSLDTRTLAQTPSEEKVVPVVVNYAPILQNIPSQSAYVGKVYSFNMIVTDSDSPASNISAALLQSPSWLQYSQFSLSGTPSTADITGEKGSKVVIQLSDGKNVVEKSFYLVVKINE